jgi:tRNA(Ile)-lysidine synthase
LILCAREQIEEYCSINNIPFVTDSTNLCDDYTRNKIRHNIVPTLKELNPSVEKAVTRMSANLRVDSSLLEKTAEDVLKRLVADNGGLNTKDFGMLDPAIKSRAVKKYIENITKTKNLQSVHIEAVLGVISGGGRVSLPDKWIADCRENRLTVFRECDIAQNKTEYVVNMTETEENFLISQQKVNNLLLKNSIDCDKIVGELVLRVRQSGDSIRLKNRGCTKPLTKLYNECEIPIDERDKLPLIADEKGVIWICGIGVAHRCAVNENSKRILIIDTEKK